MATRFVQFTRADNADTEHKQILINPDHVSTVFQSGSSQVTLVMDSGAGRDLHQHVTGNLKIKPFGRS
jgi:hypothetical protein